MKAVVNNIYAIGDYFFIDYSLQNKTKIPYDIEELRVKLTDKKQSKATNSQTIELTPVFSLNYAKKFQKNYRNVLVLPKLTFPDEKVLRLEISENQISGRVIVLTIEYEDILNADGFDSDILKTAIIILTITSNTLSNNEKAIIPFCMCGYDHWCIRARCQAINKCGISVPLYVEHYGRL